MWATKGSVPRLLLLGFTSSVLAALTALVLILGLESLGVHFVNSMALLIVTFISHIIGMLTTASMSYAVYLDDLQDYAAAEREKPPV